VLEGPKGSADGRRRASNLAGETMSPGRRGPHSHEVGEEVKNPRRGAGLCGEPLLSRYFEALKVRDTGCARLPKATREGVVAER
jgi:hypothetical protein